MLLLLICSFLVFFSLLFSLFFFFFNDTATTEIYTLSLTTLFRSTAYLRYALNTLGLFDLHFTYRSEEHTSELQSHSDLVCRLLLEKKKNKKCISNFLKKKKNKKQKNIKKITK